MDYGKFTRPKLGPPPEEGDPIFVMVNDCITMCRYADGHTEIRDKKGNLVEVWNEAVDGIEEKYGKLEYHIHYGQEGSHNYIAINENYRIYGYSDRIEVYKISTNELVETIWSDNENSHESI
ncbi:hypothetical protein [Butyricimonas hominis]|jgi:hypothetical protein|uniref:YopX protein domain-containing protein n=1 Tax=Butyricimonas hominis TaxID=2763032 RepID=A0ABR7D152_9BACT|nr:hypothetical protein [Butyricimonas hominis]MBC5621658.1 hypothetical protein [Butyricimonas hominis]